MNTSSSKIDATDIPDAARLIRVCIPIQYKKLPLELAIRCDEAGADYRIEKVDYMPGKKDEYSFYFHTAEGARQVLSDASIFGGLQAAIRITDDTRPYVFVYVKK